MSLVRKRPRPPLVNLEGPTRKIFSNRAVWAAMTSIGGERTSLEWRRLSIIALYWGMERVLGMIYLVAEASLL